MAPTISENISLPFGPQFPWISAKWESLQTITLLLFDRPRGKSSSNPGMKGKYQAEAGEEDNNDERDDAG
jgi:hypothetical protein